ncbi:MAG: hypothetical protein HY556_11070 [Euryarchaeota archaeon]|nr:hypothetical protein [Euryarchaeota archaeon]
MKDSGSTSKAFGIAIAVFMVVSAAPLSSASHRALYDDQIGTTIGQNPTGVMVRDEGLRVTLEPDFKSTEYWSPGAPVENCIADLDEVWPAVDLDPAGTFAGQCDPAAVAGDLGNNELFFDAMIFLQPASPGASEWANYNYHMKNLGLTSQDVLLPGRHGIFAWFGHWDDKNGDYKIDDVCKFVGSPANAADEFVWRGQSTLEDGGTWAAPTPPFKFVSYAWLDPGNYGIGDGATGQLFGFNRTALGPDQRLDDRTSEDNGASGCPSNTAWITNSGNPFWNYGGGLVFSVTMVAAMNPPVLPGDPRGWDMQAAKFTDVDKYSSVSPTLEDLFLGLNDAENSAESDAGNATQPHVTFVQNTVNETQIVACATITGDEAACRQSSTGAIVDFVNEQAALVCDAAAGQGVPVCDAEPNSLQGTIWSPVYGTAGSKATRTQVPPFPHEPNTPFDSYSCADADVSATCNATFGGTAYTAGPACLSDSTDHPRGSCNGYVGYQSGWHAWIDSTPLIYFPQAMRPFLLPPQVGLAVGGGVTASIFPALYSNDAGHGKYNDVVFGTGYNYHWASVIGQWKDGNLDTWVRRANFGPQSIEEPYGNGTVLVAVGVDPGNSGTGTSNFYRQGGGNYYNNTWNPDTNVDGEWINLCSVQGRVLDVSIKLVPFVNGALDPSGSWGKGVIVRWNHLEPGKPTVGDNPGRTTFDLVTSGEIVLNESCGSTLFTDSIAFLGGNYDGVEFAVVTTAVIRVDTDPFSSEDALVEEVVTDVDVHSVARD